MSFNLSVTAQELNASIAKANTAAPQSTTYTKAEVNTALAGKQSTLNSAQQNAVDSGIDSTKVDQIATNTSAITAIKDGTSIDSFADVETALSVKANTSDLGAAAAKGFDATPTSGNTNNAVSSDGVYQELVPITAELVELVDSGAKNFLPVSSGSATNNYVFNDLAVNIPAGKYIFAADIENYGSRSELVLGTSGGSIANVQFNNADSVAIQFDVTGDATSAKLYTMGGTFTNMMLCTKSAWDISHKFVPYCPSMAEIYAMIQALQ